MKVSAVLVDLGGTLVGIRDEKAVNLWEKSLLSLQQLLSRSGLSFSFDTLSSAFQSVWKRIFREDKDLDWEAFFTLFLKQVGADPDPRLIHRCIMAYYAPRVDAAVTYPETLSFLKELRLRGFKTAIVSNTNVGGRLVVEKFRLERYFDAVVLSYLVGWRKPDSRIFGEALRRLGVPPEKAVMIGDSLKADILGAKRAGLNAILICRSETSESFETEPDAIIRDLSELFDHAESVDTQ